MTVLALVPPAPYLCIGSANPISYRSADGWIYWSAHVRPATSSDARTRVFKQQGAGPSQEVPIEFYGNARGLLSMEPDGLYLTTYSGDPVIPYRVQVPGFVVPAWPGGIAPPTPAIVIDMTARNMAANAQTTATQALDASERALTWCAELVNEKPDRTETATIAAGVLANWWAMSIRYKEGFKGLHNWSYNKIMITLERRGLIQPGWLRATPEE